MRRDTPFRFSWLAHALPYICAAAIIVTLLLFTRSQHVSDTFEFSGLGTASIQFNSTEGRILLGVFEHGQRNRWRPRRASFTDLSMARGDYFGIAFDFWGWGIAVPHLMVVVLLMIPIAWWFFIFRNRSEELRRLEMGLCSNCGYDVTYSEHRCPECGEPHAHARLSDETLAPKQ